jgi:hypothetical protein
VYTRCDGYVNVFDVISTVTVPFNKILGEVLPKRIKLDAEFELSAHVGVNKRDIAAITLLTAGASAAAVTTEGLFYSIYRTAATW